MQEIDWALVEIGQVVGFVDLIEQAPVGLTPPEISETAKWFCIVVKSGQGARAEIGLYEVGFRTFTPKIRRWVSHARVKTARERPLLGRYMFVESEPTDDALATVRAVDGVDSLISNLGRPTPFPAHWVTSFRERYLAGEWDFVRTDNPCPYRNEKGELAWRHNDPMPVGARIKIIEGEFAELMATITGMNGKKVTFKVLDSTDTKTINQRSVRAA
jgi:transcription antitermination factor NusG